MSKLLIIMVGVPGSGKDTWIRNKCPDAWVCSADAYFYALGNGTYKFDPSKLGVAHEECRNRAINGMTAGEPCVVISNTNLRLRDILSYASLADRHGYRPVIVRITPSSFEAAFKRNLHGVPEEAHHRMVAAFRNLAMPEGIEVIEVQS